MRRPEFILMKALDELDEYGVIAVDTYMALTDAGYDADYVAATYLYNPSNEEDLDA